MLNENAPRSGKGLDGIQALRFLAAMLVVAMHAIDALILHGGAMRAWKSGGIGVDIFFVISGFVMALTTQNIHHGWLERKNAALMFCRRRLIRLLPLYWFYTVLKILAVLLLPTLALRATLDPGHIAASFLLFPTVAPWGVMEPILPVGWTLCLEIFFYAIFAVAIFLGAPRLVFCLLIFGLVSILHARLPQVVSLAFYQHVMVYDFAFGIFIAWAWQKFDRVPRALAVLAMVPGLLLLFGELNVNGMAFYLLRGVAAGALVWGVAVLEPVWQRVRFLPFVKHLGDASYSTYLSHSFAVPLSVFVLVKYLPLAWALVLVILFCALAGSCSYLFIERPMINFFRKNLMAGGARRAAP
jgi:exopolysaccharide production protein ExoZ